jgi:hypothetical protein
VAWDGRPTPLDVIPLQHGNATTRTHRKSSVINPSSTQRADAATTASKQRSSTMAEINNNNNNNNAMAMMKDYPMADDVDWPEAWVMTPDELLTDQSAPNRLTPNIAVSPVQMRQLGIAYWKMPDVDKYEVRIYYICCHCLEDHRTCCCGFSSPSLSWWWCLTNNKLCHNHNIFIFPVPRQGRPVRSNGCLGSKISRIARCSWV